jgi:hypothetical protein
MAQTTRLQAVGEEPVPALIGDEAATSQPPRRAEAALTGLLITSLRALSQRAIVALASLVDLALLGSVFVLALLIIGNPSVLQLIGVGGYACFALGALCMRRRAA